ncbi:hypothetical protein CMV_010081 [Castanea mollissima]|uniref:Uncharacterized protein n=1 Tax=Castanea mollissima TaxID=60419 RepID=A0A8J4W105_9ROSI|nr:hypothetical protein CMV_010081 [Castanea mollissima]
MALGFERRRRQRNGFGTPTLPAMKGVWGFYSGAGDETGLGVRVLPAMKWVFGLESESVQLTQLRRKYLMIAVVDSTSNEEVGRPNTFCDDIRPSLMHSFDDKMPS